MIRLSILGMLLIPFILYGQNSSQLIEKPKESYAFGQIYCNFHYTLNDHYDPKAAFNFNQGIIGYKHQLAENLSGIIMYDVTRTTHIFEITDTAGNALSYNYFEGSKYTAYLKMAEIKWDISDMFIFRVGQLLNTQYLTFQDKFWGYRYVDVTYQEKFRLGMPADFGAQLDFKWKNKLVNQFSVVNGEGPFRYQDINGKFIYLNNIQYYPTEKITLKLYTDYGPAHDTGVGFADKSVISGFVGYKIDKFRIGGEYSYVFNYNYADGTDFYGFSVYTGVVLSDYFQVLGRWDHLDLKTPDSTTGTNYYILGLQYEPVKPFTTALTIRYYSEGDIPSIYASFGLKF
ncbi:MAG: hypothetical protein JW731_05035 [Bacteroidales bacterium]|nr:hypothetical protein [Bacteroidales bacterium]